MTLPFAVDANIIFPERNVASEPNTATRSIHDIGKADQFTGAAYDFFYTIPYIQTSNDLFIKVENWPTADSVRFELTDMSTGNLVSTLADTTIDNADNNSFETTFNNLPKGEYRVDVYGVDANGNDIPGLTDYAEHMGIGDIILAIGDSLTQGNLGWRHNAAQASFPNSGILDWTDSDLGSSYVSQDNRNFAQAGALRPFQANQGVPVPFDQSFMPVLNDYLVECYDYPVFIMNEGWGGHESNDYLSYMSTTEWKDRVIDLEPNKAIIELAANDAIEEVNTPAIFNANMDSIVDNLQAGPLSIASNQIWMATPTYAVIPNPNGFNTDYAPFLPEIDQSISDQGINPGGDFHDFFFQNQHLLAPAPDQVHPSQLGYDEKAREWAKVLTEGTGCDYRMANPLKVSKSVFETDYTAGGAVVGDTITYQIEIENTSNVEITDVQVIDQLFNDSNAYPQYNNTSIDGLINSACSFIEPFNQSDPIEYVIPYGDIITCEIEYILTPTDIQNGFVNNSVLVESSNGDSTASNLVTEMLPEPQGSAELIITKEVTSQTYTPPVPSIGEEIVYTIRVRNNGEADATNVTIADSLEGVSPGVGLTCPGFTMPGTLASNQEVVCTFVHKITSGDIAMEAVSNTATVTGLDNGNVLEEQASRTVSFDFITAVDIQKDIDNLNYSQLPPPVGSTIDYKILVKNDSNYSLTNFFVNDSLATASNPVSCVGFTMPGTLSAGQEISCFFTYPIQPLDIDGGYITNEAFATFRDNEGAIIETEKVYKTESFDPIPSITIKKSVDKTHYSSPDPQPGDTIDYKIVIANNGNTPLQNIELTDSLGAPTCAPFPQSNNGLDPDESITCTFTYVIDSDDIENSIVYNNATVTARDYLGQLIDPISDMVSEKVSEKIGNNNSGRVIRGSRRSVRRTAPGLYKADFGPNLVTNNGNEIPELAVAIKPGWDRCDCGRQVKSLQEWLNQHGYIVKAKGNGALGKETMCFGHYTEKALIRFQETYADIILHTQGRAYGDGSLDNVTAAVIAAIDAGFIPQRIPIPLESVQGISERQAYHSIGHVPRIEY